LSFDKSYKSTSLSLVASAVGGDANLDGMIDVNDLDLLAQHWQTSGNWLNGDFNGDGFVDAIDLGILASHWQGSAGALGDALNALNVPEPTMLIVLVAVVGGAGRTRAVRFRPKAQSGGRRLPATGAPASVAGA